MDSDDKHEVCRQRGASQIFSPAKMLSNEPLEDSKLKTHEDYVRACGIPTVDLCDVEDGE